MPTEAERQARLFGSILAASDDCIKVLDLDGRLILMSEGGQRVMEVTDVAAIEGQYWPDFWPGSSRNDAEAALEVARSGGTGGFQGFAPTMAGTLKFWDVKVKPIPGPDGRPERLLSISRDITDQQAALKALKDSRERYRMLFESMDEGFCIIEFVDGPHGPLSDYVHIEANPAYTTHAGIPNVVGQQVRALVGEEAQGWIDLYGEVLRTGRPIRFERELVATGRFLELAAFRIEPESSRQVAVLFQDITARRRAEQALKELNETLEARVAEALAERKLFADMVGGMEAFVHVVDMDLRWLAFNTAAVREFERLFGVTPKVGGGMLDALADRPAELAEAKRLWARALSGEEFVERFRLAAGEATRHYEIHFSPLRNGGNRQIGAYQLVYDVTEKVAAEERLQATEEALRQAQKMEGIGQLTGGVAHDFNNLLTIIIGNLESMQRRLPETADAAEKFARPLDQAMRGAQRAASLTQRLLAFSRRQPLDPKPIEVNRLVGGMSDLLRRTIGETVAIETVLGGGLWPVHIDPNQLEMAILNLAVNARDAMPAGGRLTIETANTHLDDAYAASQAEVIPGQYVVICVSDTGTGMSAETMARVFEPFFTTKDVGHGTGLGLSQVYGFIKQSGGNVRIYSEVGEGTSVKLYIPRLHSGAGAIEPAEAAPAAAPGGSGQVVLVVEDEDNVRAYTTNAVRELGYTVIEAANGADALRLLEGRADISLLFTDVGLPGGMNGRQLADAARRLRPELKVLFTTGYARNAIVHDGRLDPGVVLLPKPYAFTALANKLYELLEVRAGARRVLVVEDEAMIQLLAVDYLEELGFQPETANTGAEALDKARLFSGQFDFAVVDIGLPDRKGDELIREMRALYPGIGVIVASGYDDVSLRESLAGETGVQFVRKPYGLEDIRGAIAKLKAGA